LPDNANAETLIPLIVLEPWCAPESLETTVKKELKRIQSGNPELSIMYP